MNTLPIFVRARRQRGFSLVELMVSVVIGLAGMPSKCLLTAPIGDSRRCPP